MLSIQSPQHSIFVILTDNWSNWKKGCQGKSSNWSVIHLFIYKHDFSVVACTISFGFKQNNLSWRSVLLLSAFHQEQMKFAYLASFEKFICLSNTQKTLLIAFAV